MKKEKSGTFAYCFSDDSGVYGELCVITLLRLEEYENEQEAKEEYDLEFNVRNLHNECASYVYEKFYTGGTPIKLKYYVLSIYDEDHQDEFEEEEISPEILAATKSFFSMSSTFEDE